MSFNKNVKADFSFSYQGNSITCVNSAASWLPEISKWYIDLSQCVVVLEEVTVTAETQIEISWIAYDNIGGSQIQAGDLAILYDSGGGSSAPSGNGNSTSCPEASLTITDGNNSSRSVGTGGTLKMVQGSGTRTANGQLTINSPDWSPSNTYPAWTSPSAANGTGASFSFPSSGTISVQCAENCPSISGNVEIAPIEQYSLSGKLNAINSSLFTLSQNIKSVLSPLSSDIGVQLELNGSGIIKNVDKYNDGANIGRYIDMSLGASGGISLPEVESPDLPLGPFTVKGKLKMGLVSLSGSVNGIYDESQSNPGNITGEVVFNFANPTVEASLILGNPELICIAATGSVVSSGMEIKGVFSFSDHTLKVTPMYSISQIKGIVAIEGKINLFDMTCNFWNGEHVFYSGNNGSGSAITLYTFE